MTTYKKLSDLLNGETPYEFARGVYKGTACGPWISYVLKDGKDIYYEDKKAKKISDKSCIGVKIGSIVEGSDVEVGPINIMFPFTDKEFWEKVEEINKEASFYWERDNTDNFRILKGKKDMGLVAWTQWDDKAQWTGKIPDDIKRKWEQWYSKDRFKDGACVIPEDNTWTFTKGWTCIQFENDITY